MTIGQLLIDEALPNEYRGRVGELNKKSLSSLLTLIAKTHPDKYSDVVKKLHDIGAEVSYESGSTIRLSDLMPNIPDRQKLFTHVKQQIRKIRSLNVPEDQKKQAIGQVFSDMSKLIRDETLKIGQAKGNKLAEHVVSGARGGPLQLAAVQESPGFYTDANDELIPVFIQRSFSEGLKPHEYWASTYGARKGVISTKFATQEGGDFGKQVTKASGNLIVTEDDCGTIAGVPVKADDDDNIGSLLAKRYLNYPVNTPITKEVLADLKKAKLDEVVVRSPITCAAHDGLCRYCSGIRESGRLPDIRDHIGISAGSAIAERIAQGALNVKHTSGQKSDKNQYGGFAIINQLAQVQKQFPHRAAVAEVDGVVKSVEPAPQGGYNITIGENSHYVDPEQEVTIKPGARVEAGDILSTGIANPAEIVQHKGIGEGRRYFMNRFAQAMRDSGLAFNRRNVEVVSRALVDKVSIDDQDGLGDFLPGDEVSYNSLAKTYRPREDAQAMDIRAARGKYLEQPLLHYSIGTRITDNVMETLKKHGEKNALVHNDKPAFSPEMLRLRAGQYFGKDWMAKLWTSNLKANLLKDVHTGEESNIHGTHPIPAVAYGLELGESKPGKVTF